MSQVSNAFTAVGNGNVLRVAPGASVNYTITGSASATLAVQRLVNGGATAAETLISGIAASGNPTGTFRNDTPEFQSYRFVCTAYTSGTATAVLDDVNSQALILTASTTLDRSVHANKAFVLNHAAGATHTLPPAIGSGETYEFIFGTTITSNTAVLRVNSATDYFRGMAVQSQDGGNTVQAWETANSGTVGTESDTMTFDGSTRGGLVGDRVLVRDIAAGVWMVQSSLVGTGTEATPFSAAV